MTKKVRWCAAAALAVLLVLPSTPADARAAAAARTISIQAPSATTTGAIITVRGRVTRSPKGSSVVLRRKSGTRWVKVTATRTTNRYGDFAFRIRAPTTGGTYKYRASAPRTSRSPAVVSVARSIVVRVQVRASLVASNLTPVEAGPVTLSGIVSPWLAGTPVTLQKRVGAASTWSTARSIVPDSTGRFRLSEIPQAGSVSRYRVYVGPRTYRTSALSAAVTVTPVANGPAVVTGLTAASTSKQVQLNWTNPAGTTGVTVRRSEGSTPPATAGAGTAVPTTGVVNAATDSAVEEDRSYAYSVFATTAAGTSPPVSTVRPGPPPATGGWHTAVPGKVNFHWTNPAGVDHVVVDVSYTGGVWLGPGLPPTGTRLGAVDSFTVSGLTSHQWVYLTIYTLDASGNFQGNHRIGARSPDGTDTPSGPVTAPIADALPHAVTLRWTSPESAPRSDVAITRVEGAIPPASPTSGWIVGRTSSTETTTDDMVEPGRTYTYGLWAVDSSGNYSTRSSVTVTTPRGSPPGPVTGLTATALSPTVGTGTTGYDPQRVRLHWTNPPGADAIVVARTEGSTAPASPLVAGGWNLPLPADRLLDNELTPDTVYSYAVWAVGQDGTYSTVATTTVRSDPNTRRAVHGRVIDSRSGAAVGSVPLTFHSRSDQAPPAGGTFSTTSDPDGSYDIDLPVGRYGVCVDGTSVTGSTPGYVDSCTPADVPSAPTTSLDVPIDRSVSIRGIVTDGSTGAPVAGVRVSTIRPPPYQYETVVTTTAADGSYLLTGISAKATPDTKVHVNPTTATNGAPQGYDSDVPTTWVATSTPGETVRHDATITPLRVVTISGRVTNASGAAAVPEVGVHLVDRFGVDDGIPLTFTGADGRYTVTTALGADDAVSVCFDAERHRTPAAATGYGNQCFGGADFAPGPPASPGDTSVFGTTTPVSTSSQVDVALAAASTVSGKVVTPEGAALAGVVVTVIKHNGDVRRTTTTDTAGKFVLRIGASPTGATLPIAICANPAAASGGASSGGYASPECLQKYAWSTTPTTGVDFVAQPAAAIAGAVEDSVSGDSLAGITVELEQENTGGTVRSATTAADGSYTLRQIRPEAGRSYRVCAGGPGRARTCATLDELGIPALSVGTTAHAGPLLVPEQGTISGVLTGADTGDPIAGVRVELDGDNGGLTTTDADGRYSFDRLRPGPYRLRASANTAGPRGYHTTATNGFTVEVSAGQDTTANVAMLPAAAVRIKVVTPDGRPAPGVSLALRDDLAYRDVRTDSQGLGTLKGLTPSEYPLHEAVCAGLGNVGPGTRAGYTPGCGWLPVLTDGQTATTTVVVGFGGAFGAWVRDASTGEPIDGARVALSVPNGDYFTTHNWHTDVQGFSYPYTAVNPPRDGISVNPGRPQFGTARICVTAIGYAPACFRGGAPDGQSGPLMGARPGMRTIATFALTRN